MTSVPPRAQGEPCLSADAAASEREGFYEKLWKDFVSIQRGDMQEICRCAERYRLWRTLQCADDDCEGLNRLQGKGFNSEAEWDAILDAELAAFLRTSDGLNTTEAQGNRSL
jgi:hypothetical protein